MVDPVSLTPIVPSSSPAVSSHGQKPRWCTGLPRQGRSVNRGIEPAPNVWCHAKKHGLTEETSAVAVPPSGPARPTGDHARGVRVRSKAPPPNTRFQRRGDRRRISWITARAFRCTSSAGINFAWPISISSKRRPISPFHADSISGEAKPSTLVNKVSASSIRSLGAKARARLVSSLACVVIAAGCTAIPQLQIRNRDLEGSLPCRPDLSASPSTARS